MNKWRRDKNKKYSLVLGHRGAMGIAPENTIVGIKIALDIHVDMFEIDVHLSRDKKLIIIHDEKVDRTTDGTGYISNLKSKYIRSLDAGIKFSKKFKGLRVPFLEEVFDLMKNTDARLNLEIKNGPVFYKGIEDHIIELIDSYDYYDRVLVSSFDHHTLKKIKQINKRVDTAILYGSNLYDLEKYIELLEVSAVHPHYFWATRDLTKKMHNMDIAVNTWILNEKEDFKKFSRMGIDSIGTNYPDRMQF